MAINLEKRAETVKIVLDKIGFNEKIKVVMAIDISSSMLNAFHNGHVQDLIERTLAIGMNIDKDKSIDVYMFNHSSQYVGSVNPDTIDNFVQREILNAYSIGGGTNYAPVMKEIAADYKHYSVFSNFIDDEQNQNQNKPKKRGLLKRLFGFNDDSNSSNTSKNSEVPAESLKTDGEETLVVFFITDGENMDAPESEKFIKNISDKPIFWQFIGINAAMSYYPFLEHLDEMEGRVIDNANFFDAGDINHISDNELYKRILVEMPVWYKEAKEKGVIK